MTEGTKQFLLQNLQWVIRLLVVVAVLVVLYLEFSPYRQCLEARETGDLGRVTAGFCWDHTSW